MSENEKSAASESKPRRILIRASNWLGDAVMTTPAVRAIRRSFPDAHLAVLTRGKLADFWKIVIEVDEVIPIGPGESVLGVAKKIAGKFDAAVLFPNSVRSALEVFFARIPRRIGWRGKLRSRLLTGILDKKETASPLRHQMRHHLDLAEFFGARIDDRSRGPDGAFGSIQNPKSSEADGRERQSKLIRGRWAGAAIQTRQRPMGHGGNPKIGLCAGAEYGPAKRWLPERFAEVVRAVSSRRACDWVFFGTEKETPIGGEIANRLDGNFTNLTGKTTLGELIATLPECRLLLTNDTGTMHLAAFLGVPTLSLFGSTEPALTGPLGPGHRVLRHHVECSPCFLRTCPLDFRCMKSIETDEVVEAVLRMIGE